MQADVDRQAGGDLRAIGARAGSRRADPQDERGHLGAVADPGDRGGRLVAEGVGAARPGGGGEARSWTRAWATAGWRPSWPRSSRRTPYTGSSSDPVLYARAAQNLRRVLRIAARPSPGCSLSRATTATSPPMRPAGSTCGQWAWWLTIRTATRSGWRASSRRTPVPAPACACSPTTAKLRIDELVLRAERDLPAEYGPDWRLAVYRGPPGAGGG